MRTRERPIEPDYDELVRIGLTGDPAGAERIVVVVEDAQVLPIEHDHALNRLEREPERRTEAAEIVRVLDVQQLGDLAGGARGRADDHGRATVR